MFRAPSSRKHVVSALRILAMRHPTSQVELDALVEDSASISQYIQNSPDLVNGAPEMVWHFLSDADIRFKDRKYAETQLEGLRSALAKWERESGT